MFYLTRQERLVLIILAAALAVGAAVRVIRGRVVPPPPAAVDVTMDLSRPKAPATPPASAASGNAEPAPATPINVNAADAEELCKLPGVGPAIADRIVAYRERHGPFEKASDLARVKGISKKKARELEPLCVFGK